MLLGRNQRAAASASRQRGFFYAACKLAPVDQGELDVGAPVDTEELYRRSASPLGFWS
jgi:hypothetical protein